MKYRIATHIILSLSTYSICYLIGCYLQWEIFNPFYWIVKLPNENLEYRLGVLGGLFLYQFIIAFASFIICEEHKNKSK